MTASGATRPFSLPHDRSIAAALTGPGIAALTGMAKAGKICHDLSSYEREMTPMVRLGYCFGAGDVAMTLAVLSAHGYAPRCEDQGMGLTVSPFTTAIGGMAVHVPPDQAAEAAALLADLPPLVQNRPGLPALITMLIVFLLSYTPPPATGLYLRRLVHAGTGAAT
jgi:hypothetical protein